VTTGITHSVESSWTECYDQDNNRYYYNAVTGESSWEMPTSDWVECADEQGNKYFYDQITGATQWELPPALSESTFSSAITAPTSSISAAGGDGQIVVADDWVECLDEGGNTYYYNQVTGTTQWEDPSSSTPQASSLLEGYEQPLAIEGDEKQSQILAIEGPGDWEQYYDENGNPYYYSPSTGESRWQNPNDMALVPQAQGNDWDSSDESAHLALLEGTGGGDSGSLADGKSIDGNEQLAEGSLEYDPSSANYYETSNEGGDVWEPAYDEEGRVYYVNMR